MPYPTQGKKAGGGGEAKTLDGRGRSPGTIAANAARQAEAEARREAEEEARKALAAQLSVSDLDGCIKTIEWYLQRFAERADFSAGGVIAVVKAVEAAAKIHGMRAEGAARSDGAILEVRIRQRTAEEIKAIRVKQAERDGDAADD